MKKFIVFSVISAVIIAGLAMSNTYAWNFGLSGKAECQSDGSYVITWTLDNTSEEEALNITRSTNPSVIPVGAEVPAHKSYVFTQKVDGTKPSMHRMLVKGHWQSDQNQITSAAKVALDTPCQQPKPVVRTPAPIPPASVPVSQPVEIPTTGGGK